MNLKSGNKIDYNIKIQGKEYKSFMIVKDNNKSIKIDNLQLDIKYEEDLVNINIRNFLESEIEINKIQLELLSLPIENYYSYISNPEYSNEKITKNPIEKIKNGESKISFSYNIFDGKEEFQSQLIGFLSNHISRNYIKIVRKDEDIHVYAVYDFIKHNIKGKDTLELDPLYLGCANRYFKVIDNYVLKILEKKHLNKRLEINEEILDLYAQRVEESLLFTESVCDETLKINNKPAAIKIGKKKQYLINIFSEEGKRIILNKCLKVIDDKGKFIFIKNIQDYILKIIKEAAFNPYYELNNLFKYLNENIENLKLCFDDCPKGLAIGNFNIINENIDVINKKNFKDKLIRKNNKQDLNWNFIMKTMLQNNIFNHDTKYNINDNEIKKVMDIINMNFNVSTLKNSELLKVIKDNDINQNLGVYRKKKNVFSVWRAGKEAVYIGVFNISDAEEEVYIDLALHSNYNISNGSAKDVLTDEHYLILDNKIYIPELNPNECRLIKKTIHKEE